MKYLILLTVVIALGVMTLGCGDDDDAADTGETPAATTEGTPEPARRTESIAALRAYLNDVGLDDSTGELSDPVECGSLPESGGDGDFCLLETSTFTPALALILVADKKRPDQRAWQVRVVLEDGSWRVTETVRFESE